MYLERSPKPQTGAGLPLAIFIVTVLSLIVLGMSQLQQSSGKALSLQIQSQRAFFAAESGAQVAVERLLREESCPARINFDRQGLSDCAVDLACSGTDIIVVRSEGSCGSGQERASRVVEVRLQ